jgi:pyruvate-formate lyase-activating enzyme
MFSHRGDKVEGCIFNIMKYSIHDGPGIRTTVFMKGCPLRCLWCHNPESQMSKPQLIRFSDRCIGCGSCAKVCSTGAIIIRESKIIYDMTKCTNCGQCAEVCYAGAIEYTCPLNVPTKLAVPFEGIADNGIKFIGWYENEDDVIARLYQNLASKMSLTSAHMIYEENYDVETVSKYYKETVQGTDEFIKTKMRFLTYSFRGHYIYSYWRGNEAVENIYNKVTKQDAMSFLKYLYRNMNSINTLDQFL